MVEPICALPPLSESLRDSQGASSVQHWTVIERMREPPGGMGLIIYELRNRWGEIQTKPFQGIHYCLIKTSF